VAPADEKILASDRYYNALELHTTPTSLIEDSAGRAAHGPDERVPTKWLDDGVRYLRDVVMNLGR